MMVMAPPVFNKDRTGILADRNGLPKCECCATSCEACSQQDLTCMVRDVSLFGVGHGDGELSLTRKFCINRCLKSAITEPAACNTWSSPTWIWNFQGLIDAVRVETNFGVRHLRPDFCDGSGVEYQFQSHTLIGIGFGACIARACDDFGLSMNPCSPPDYSRFAGGSGCSLTVEVGL